MNKTTATKQWPETAPYNDAINAFDAALTRAGWDEAFRKRLIESPASAKAAVAEIGDIIIPENRVIVFYEPQGPLTDAAEKASAQRSAARALAAAGSTSSENVHVFYLPPLNQDGETRPYTYEEYFMCCYDQWRRT